jgi:hypothetical protein
MNSKFARTTTSQHLFITSISAFVDRDTAETHSIEKQRVLKICPMQHLYLKSTLLHEQFPLISKAADKRSTSSPPYRQQRISSYRWHRSDAKRVLQSDRLKLLPDDLEWRILTKLSSSRRSPSQGIVRPTPSVYYHLQTKSYCLWPRC